MHSPISDWLTSKFPHRTEDGATWLRWTNREGNIQEAPVDYVAAQFGPTIQAAIDDNADVVEAIQSGDFDDAWKDIWQLWREYGWV